jgi:3-dehydroquinate dehydratase type I
MSLHKTPVSCNNDLIGHNFKVGKQTFIIPLIFTNINDVKDIITRIGYGGDVWELRVDLLSPNAGPLGETNLPPLEYVKQQVEALRSILFTIRTQSQGGKFPDKAAEEALALMLVAVACGIKYIDVEVEWPASMLETITEKKGSSQVVASFHDWTGNIRWTSQALKERFKAADKFGGEHIWNSNLSLMF